MSSYTLVGRLLWSDYQQVKIDYKAHAVVEGTKLTAGYSRGGKLAEGSLAKMIVIALDFIDRDYVGVMVLVDGGLTWQADKIREVSQRADFPCAT